MSSDPRLLGERWRCVGLGHEAAGSAAGFVADAAELLEPREAAHAGRYGQHYEEENEGPSGQRRSMHVDGMHCVAVDVYRVLYRVGVPAAHGFSSVGDDGHRPGLGRCVAVEQPGVLDSGVWLSSQQEYVE